MMQTYLDEDFIKVVNNIKNEIRTTQINAFKYVNSSLIMMNFRIGKILDENSKYGNNFIGKVANALKIEFPSIKGFSLSNLKYMKKFYNEYKDSKKVQQLVAQLPWGHNILLIEKINDINIRKIYIKAAIRG